MWIKVRTKSRVEGMLPNSVKGNVNWLQTYDSQKRCKEEWAWEQEKIKNEIEVDVW